MSAKDTKVREKVRGAPPRTPVKGLLGKTLNNPQNLLIGERDYWALRMGDSEKAKNAQKAVLL